MDRIIATLHAYERKVLPALKETSSFEKLAEITKLQKVEVMRALQWLQNKEIVRINKQLKEQIVLDENGIKYLKKGLPEKKFLEQIKEKSALEDIEKNSNLSKQELSISLGILKSKGAIEITKENGIIVQITDIGRELLKKGFPEESFIKKNFPLNSSELKDLDKLAFENLRKRNKIIKTNIAKIITAFPTELGKKIIEYGIKEEKVIDRLTPEIIKTGLWKSRKLRGYDVKINVPNISGGRLHFVTQAMQYIKRIWLDMGFEEMEGNIIQQSFWNFDSLFTPQDHPARDLQDSIFLNRKEEIEDKELMKKIKDVH